MSLTTFINDRPIQTKAFNEVTKLLQTRDECLVKMFCGTGKSRVIQRIILERKHPLSVVVFPSLALIRQFTNEYLGKVKNIGLLNVSSEELAHITSTTDPAQIHHFLNNPKTKHQQKIICVTYQSLDVLLSSIGDTKIGIACFDEAHRTTSPEAKELVYGDEYRAKYEKRVFFTATPVNANGITMFDRERDEMRTYGDCGPLACEYTYLQGLRDGILSLFELRIDLYTQDTLGNMYESIARAILTREIHACLHSMLMQQQRVIRKHPYCDSWIKRNSSRRFVRCVRRSFLKKSGCSLMNASLSAQSPRPQKTRTQSSGRLIHAPTPKSILSRRAERLVRV